MKWTMIYTHRFYFSFVVLLASFFMSFFCLSSDSFATSFSYTVSSSFAGGYLCHNGSPDATVLIDVNCSDFSYWSVQWSAQNYPSSTETLRVTSLGGTVNFPLRTSTFSLFSIDVSALYVFSGTFTPSNYTSIVLTLYDDLPGSGSGSGIVPSGSLSITENGTYDVTNYAEAVVDVPVSGGSGDSDCTYTGILQDIKSAIIFVPAVLLVIYFFYAIYKMIMGGVRR